LLIAGGIPRHLRRIAAALVLAGAVTLAAQTVNYSYDQAGRLSSVIYPNGTTATYTYDASGNLLRKVIAATATGPAPAVLNNGVVNAASEQGTTVAPGEMVVIYGNGIGPTALSFFQITPASFFDTIAGNTTVTFDGIPAPFYYASAGQTVVIVPYSVAGQTSTQMVVTYNGVASPPTKLSVAPSVPGLFSANASGTGNGSIVNSDGTVNTPANPAARGSYISLYGTGEGQTNPRGVDGRIALSVYPKPVLPVKVTIGGVDATSGILYVGAAPTLVAGVFQLTVTIPSNVPAGAVPVVVTVGSASSQTGLIWPAAILMCATATAQSVQSLNLAVGATYKSPITTYSNCTFSTTTVATPQSIAGSDTTTIKGNGDTTFYFTVTGAFPGKTVIVITSSNPSCSFSTITLNVTVGNPTAPLMSGNTLNAPVLVDPVSGATGELFGHDETADLRLGGPTGLEFRRYYGSFLAANKVPSALGTNWMHNFDVGLAVSGTSATVTLFRAKTITFTQSGAAWNLSSNEQRPYQLAAVTGGGYQFLDPTSNRIYAFNSAGVLGAMQDRNGNTITLTQGANGPTSISDGLGRTLTFTYTGTNLTKVQDQSGRSVTFQYTSGTLTGFTDANGNQTAYAYTASGGVNGLMTAETRAAGNKPFTQTFDGSGRVATQADSFANTMTLAYSASGVTLTETAGVSLTEANDSNSNLTATTDPNGAVSKYSYDSNNRPNATTDRLGNQSKATWDAASGLPTSYTDELGNTTSFTYAVSTVGGLTFYDVAGSTFADGTSITLARDASGNITSVTDQAGNSWKSTYTANGWLATTTNPAGGVYTFSSNSDGTRASVQSPSSDTTKFAYDSLSRPNLVTNPDNSTKSLQYDAVGNILKAVDERSNSSSSSFDANNNPKAGTDAVAATTNVAFDTDDRLASVTDPLGKPPQRHTTRSRA